jgi:hypothetical protein
MDIARMNVPPVNPATNKRLIEKPLSTLDYIFVSHLRGREHYIKRAVGSAVTKTIGIETDPSLQTNMEDQTSEYDRDSFS